jgi:hypothetical protein
LYLKKIVENKLELERAELLVDNLPDNLVRRHDKLTEQVSSTRFKDRDAQVDFIQRLQRPDDLDCRMVSTSSGCCRSGSIVTFFLENMAGDLFLPRSATSDRR